MAIAYEVVLGTWPSEPEERYEDDPLVVVSLSEARQSERLVDKLLGRRS